MNKIKLFIAIFFIALVGKINAQTPATLPYSCDFSDATERSNWILRNTSNNTLAKWFFQYEPMGEDHFLSCGNGSDWIYQPDDAPVTVYALRKFNCGNADSIRISFTYRVEGEGNSRDGMAYDYITALFADTDVQLQAKDSVDASVLGNSDEYKSYMLFNHADGIPATLNDSVNACKLFMKNGEFTTTIKNPNPNGTATLIFAWKNDDAGTNSSNNRAGWIDDISITPIGIDYGISIGNVRITDKNCNDVKTGYGGGKIFYNPETNTLTLDNAHIYFLYDKFNGHIGFDDNIEDITITLVGENIVEGGIGSVKGTKTINGTGTLRIPNEEIGCYEKHTIIEDCTVSVVAYAYATTQFNTAMVGDVENGSKLTIKNANLSVESKYITIGGFADIELIGCEIVEPVNAQILDMEYDSYEGKFICNEDGTPARKVVIKKKDSGIESIANNNSISIYPNPAKESVTIEGKGEITITNSLGQVVKEIKDNNTYRILNIKDFERGVYYIKVGNTTQKLVVE